MKRQIVSIAVAFTVTVLASAHVEIGKVEENKVVFSYNLQEAATAAASRSIHLTPFDGVPTPGRVYIDLHLGSRFGNCDRYDECRQDFVPPVT